MSADIVHTLTPYLTLSFLLSAMGGFAGAYFTGYLRKKGEDRAVKESLDEFTRIAEGIKHDYNMLAEQFRANQTHRFLAAEKRLETHQQAFVEWRAVFDSIDDRGSLYPAVENARRWWNANCLYLDPKARHAFNEGLNAVVQWATFNSSNEEHERQWNVFYETPVAIFNAAQVPPLAKDELPRQPPQVAGALR